VLSLEMPAEDLLSRSIAWISGINHAILDRGGMDFSGRMGSSVTDAIDEVSKLPIEYDDCPAVTLGGIRGAVRRAARRLGGPIDLLVIDYFQLVKTSGRKNATRAELLGEVSHGVLAIARDFDLAVIEVAQLKRPVNGAKPAAPRLEDIRECGDIEQDARVVIGLHREDLTQTSGLCEAHVLKCRQGGRVGRVELAWNGPTLSFHDHGPATLADEHFDDGL
jgi:replicative DNA helicase